MRILVTGGSGFIGSKVVAALAPSHHVQVFDNQSNGSIVRPQAIYHNLDVSDFEPTRLDVDCIVHMAARTCVRECINDPGFTSQVNITGTAKIIETARLSKAELVFISSSVAAYPYMNIYGMSKSIGEELCKLYYSIYKLPVIILRPFNVYGRDSRTSVIAIFERLTRAGQELSITGDGSQRCDFTYVDDIVDGVCRAVICKKECQTIDLGTGSNHSVAELAQMFQPDVPRKWLPSVPGELLLSKADPSMASSILGWEAKMSVPRYIKEFRATLESCHQVE